jgi:hypothetical protein
MDGVALIEVADVALAGGTDGLLTGFGIDNPRPGHAGDSYSLDLRGWVLGRDLRPKSVAIVQDGALLRRVPVDGERPDITAAHPDVEGAAESGFFAPLGGAALNREFELGVFTRLEDSTRVDLATIRGRRAPLDTGFDARIQPLMLTTLGRTGSTAVVRLLGSHPDVVAYRPFEYEPRIATYWMGVLKGLSDPVSYRRQITPNGPIDGAWWLGTELPRLPRRIKDPAIQDWLAGESVTELALFCQGRIERLYERIGSLLERARPQYFVEKFRPDGVPALMSELYPGAREIVLVRDFRDMVSSMFAYNEKRGFQGFRRDRAASDEEYVAENVGPSVAALAAAWRSRAKSAHLLRYEDLVLAPEETVAALLEYLGLDPSPGTVDAMLASIGTADTEGHRTVADPRATIGRWRTDLAPQLQRVCADVLGPALESFGYADGTG